MARLAVVLGVSALTARLQIRTSQVRILPGVTKRSVALDCMALSNSLSHMSQGEALLRCRLQLHDAALIYVQFLRYMRRVRIGSLKSVPSD